MVTRLRLSVLLASTAVAGLTGVAARAQTTSVAPSTTATASTPAASAATPVQGEAKTEVVNVTGRTALTRSPGAGLMRVEKDPKAIQTITRDFISKQSPTTNIQQILKMLPSANVMDQDSFGLYSGSTMVRGLDQTNIGWTLDGMPLNDIGGGQFYSNEVLEAEDLETVSLLPGSVNLDSPIVSGAGGLVEATMSNPSHKMGGLLDISFGSFDMTRQFLKLNSGDIGNSGVRFMFAFSHTKANNYRGPGLSEKFHYDFKLVKDFENGSHTGLTVSYNDQVNDSFLNPSLSQYRTTGYSTNYDANYGGVKDANYYRLHVNPFRNVVAILPSHIVVNSRLSIDDSAYFWHGIGNGTGASTLTEGKTYYGGAYVPIDLTGDGRVTNGATYLALTPSNQEQFRPGNTIKVNYQLGSHHHLTAGWWYEYANLLQYSPVGRVNQATGEPYNIWGTNALVKMPNGQPYNYRDFLSLSQVNMLFIGDSMDYFDRKLHIDLGFKEAMVTRRVYNYVTGPGGIYNRNLHVAEPLPQIGIAWNFNRHHQIFVDGATNFKVPSNTSLVDYYSNTSAAQTQRGGASVPQYSISEEIGYRYNGDTVIGSVSFFNYNMTNRLLTLTQYNSAGGASYSQTVNAGGQTSRGVDVQVSTRPILYHLRPYASFEYLSARIDNNIGTTGVRNGVTIADYLPTKGKNQINSPKVMAALGLDYDDGRLFVGAQIKYVGKQYATLMNDSSIPNYITDAVNIGYRFGSLGFLKSPQIQLNMTNLTNAKFRSGVYTFQNTLNGVTGVRGSTITGAQPVYYLQTPFTAVVTVSTGF
ncbi:TonB-dependent receptor [Gluconacetobacter tumulicola]|uniref:TonB-dependent receptor n=1 Tax=Gluconacetobacter tumulicola TaxID=1017177 RepID=A0A7W4JBS9_9PROT|nr:TonB-dependent receptor [Gluconacetobacter tumulicola]MBB2178374.1 TonB-dependent receptor [Gluconacetobacter tumulicola]